MEFIMSFKNGYSHTIHACYVAYITQAIAANYVPLLFITFQHTYSVSLAQISILIAVTFIIQMFVDVISTSFVDKIGRRICVVAAHLMAAAGFIMLGTLPDLFRNPFYGILTACFFYSIGSGLIEVLVSPLVESCPTDHKASAMALLHSFFSWGTVLVVLLSTLFFNIFGIGNWRILTMLWAVLPLVTAFLFTQVPINSSDETVGGGMTALFRHKIIWPLILMMIAGGASEVAMSQWASAFAESGLHVSKTMGDLMGPCMFAILMGIGRTFYSGLVKRFDLVRYMIICAVLCVITYLTAALSHNSVVALAGCAATGFCVGVFWPGTYSYAARIIPTGGTAMFGILAFAGDIGCTVGPGLVGAVSGAFDNNLKFGLLAAVVYPLIMIAAAGFIMIITKKGADTVKKDAK